MHTSRLQPELAARFAAPPPDARPMVRWWWFGTAISEADIDDQLASMARAGIGGVEASFVYPLAPEQPHAFGSVPFLAKVGHAARRARELGLRFDLTLGSGWSYGGAHVPASLAAQRLRWEERSIGPRSERLSLPGRWPGDRLVAAYLAEGAPGEHGDAFAPLALDGDVVVVPLGRGPRTLLIATSGATGQQVKRSSNGAEGPVLDHYSREAAEHHLRALADPLLDAAGAANVTAVFCDSLEVYHADWTPELVAEFRARRGYDPLPHLFHLRGTRGAGARFRADHHRTLSELYEECFLATIHAWARERGVGLRVQNYGAPPARVSGYRHADLIEGEGWGWRGLPQTKWASSAAHHLGASVVPSETWTWVNSPSFRARPIDLKGEAHEHALAGINQFIGHGWPSSPRDALAPGWAFYASGALTDRNAWWPAAPALFQYLRRLSWALRQGEHVADLALWLPYVDAYDSFGDGGEANLWRRCAELLGEVPRVIREAGHDFDAIDAQTPLDSVLRRHKAVIVAGSTRLTEEDAARLRDLAEAGLTVVAVDTELLPDALHTTTAALADTLGRIVTPDAVTSDPAVGVVHRRLDGAELYFVANTGPERCETELVPREAFASWEVWDAHDGSTVPGDGPIRLALAPYEAAIVVTSPEPGELAVPVEPRPEPPIRLGEWHFTGPEGQRRPVALPHVWEEDGLDGFMGPGLYDATIVLDGSLPSRLVLDASGLPVPPRTARQPQSFQARNPEPLAAVAVVRVNGTEAGVLWDPPYEVDVGDLLHEGENRIEIEAHGKSVPAMRDPKWQRVYADAEAAHGRRFVMQEIDRVFEPTRTGLFFAPELR